MTGYKRVNFYDLCRLCASNQQKEKTHIFQEDGRKIQLQTKIEAVLSLKVAEDDYLPKVVCSRCLSSLEEYETFRNECVTSESMLSSYYNNYRLSDDFTKFGKVYVKDTSPKAAETEDPLNVDQVALSPVTVMVTAPTNTNILNNQPKTDLDESIPVYILPVDKLFQQSPKDLKPVSYNNIKVDNKNEPNNVIISPSAEPVNVSYDIVNFESLLNANLRLKNCKPNKRYTKANLLRVPQQVISDNNNISPQQQVITPQISHVEPHKLPQKKAIISKITEAYKISTQESIKHPKVIQVNPTANIHIQENIIIHSPEVVDVVGSPIRDQHQNCFFSNVTAASQSETLNNLNGTKKSVMVVNKSNADTLGSQTIGFNLVENNIADEEESKPIINALEVQAVGCQDGFSLVSIDRGSIIQEKTSKSVVESQTAVHIKCENNYQLISDKQPKQIVGGLDHQGTSGFNVTGISRANMQLEKQPGTVLTTLAPSISHEINLDDSNDKIIESGDNQELTTISPDWINGITNPLSQSENINANKKLKADDTPQVKPFECAVCKKMFKRREHLYQHARLHTGQRPFTCEHCSRSFMRKEHLVRHQTSHSGVKNFPCDVCGKSFSRNDNLLKHKKTHEKIAHFVCEFCDKHFVLKHYYEAHVAGHTDASQQGIKAN